MVPKEIFREDFPGSWKKTKPNKSQNIIAAKRHVTSCASYPVITSSIFNSYPTNIYLFKVINGNTRRCEICSKLTIKVPERRFLLSLLVSLLLTFKYSTTFFKCFFCQLWTCKYLLGNVFQLKDWVFSFVRKLYSW